MFFLFRIPLLFTDLEGQVGIFMHAEDLWIIYDGKTLNVFLTLLQFICLWGIVDTFKT